MSKTRKNEPERREGLKRLEYEVMMFRRIFEEFPRQQESATSAACVVGANQAGDEGQFTVNVYLESFLVHTRNILCFLRHKDEKGFRRFPDGIYAVDYFADPKEWLKVQVDIPDFLETTYFRAHTMLAHISLKHMYDKPEAKEWKIADILHNLNPLIQKFYDNLPQSLK